MTTRRTFLRNTALATAALATNPIPLFAVNRKVKARRQLKLTFEPYELKLRHVFTVATYSRSTTPDIQVRLDYDGQRLDDTVSHRMDTIRDLLKNTVL